MPMSSQRGPARLSLALAALLFAVHPGAALWREFALGSDRSDDSLILEALEDATLDERLEILEAVGERDDPFIGRYLEDFLLRQGPDRPVREHLMRVLLASAFPREAPLERLAARVAPNRASLLAMCTRLATFSDPQLCAAVVRLIPLLEGGHADLLALVGRLTKRLQASGGLIDPRENGLLLDALEAMRRVGSLDFLEAALAVARLSRERVVVETAREVARALAHGGAGR